MRYNNVFRLWLGLLALLAFASYQWPGFGVVFVCASLILLGVANRLLSIQSKTLGRYSGGSAAVLALAACAGASLNPLALVAFTAFAALAGYGFVAMPVGTTRPSASHEEDNRRSTSLVGGGGQADGGGASGDF